jgi:Tol biopolymer transport system component
MDINGENQIRLTTPPGMHSYAQFSPDGRWVVFNSILDDDKCSIWRMPAEGGTPERLAADQDACRPRLSPDGRSILFVSGYGRPDAPFRFVVYPIDGDAPERVMDLPAISRRRIFDWSPDGRSIIYVDRLNNVDNLWRQPLDGGPAEQLTKFDHDWIFRFAIAPNGAIALSRGNEATDAVLIQTGF